MKRFVSKASLVNWTGSVGVFALIVAFGAAQAGQEQGRQGGVIQKGKSGLTERARSADGGNGLTAGAVAGIAVARSEDQSACASGAAAACRVIEQGLTTGGAWAFVDSGVMGLDDWERQAAVVSSVGALSGSGGGAASPSYARDSTATLSSSGPARGGRIPDAMIVHRALAACDGGDVRACTAFARSVRPATAAERSETRTYTAGR